MKTVCPNCHQKYEVPEDYLQQTLLCEKCLRDFIVTKTKFCTACGTANPSLNFECWKCKEEFSIQLKSAPEEEALPPELPPIAEKENELTSSLPVEFKVNFQSDLLIREKGKKISILNEGTLVIENGCIQIRGKGLTKLRWTYQEKILTYALDQIKNFVAIEKKAQFSIFPAEQAHAQIPEYVCIIEASSEEEINQLRNLLPLTMTKKFEEELNLHEKFFPILISLTPSTPFTYSILGINVLFFLCMFLMGGSAVFFNPPPELLLKIGADFPPLTLGGQWWRILTCTFVHIGIIHLALNMFCLYQAGPIVERLYGNGIFLIVYLGAGVFGSLASLYTNADIISAGASGAIFGIYGALLAFFLKFRNRIPTAIFKETAWSSTAFIMYNLSQGMKTENINNAAHVGGLIGGFLLGIVGAMPLVQEKRTQYSKYMFRTLGVLIAACIIAMPFLSGIADNHRKWEAFIEFSRNTESEANRIWDNIFTDVQGDKISDAEFALRIERDVIPLWQEILLRGNALNLSTTKRNKKTYEFITYVSQSWLDIAQTMVRAIKNKDENLVKEVIKKEEELNNYVKSISEAKR